MDNIKLVKVDICKVPRSQRKQIGMIAQRHLEKNPPGTVKSLAILLRNHINSNLAGDNRAASWLLARLEASPELAEINCRNYICELMYD